MDPDCGFILFQVTPGATSKYIAREALDLYVIFMFPRELTPVMQRLGIRLRSILNPYTADWCGYIRQRCPNSILIEFSKRLDSKQIKETRKRS